MAWLPARYALRSVGRNLRRTALSVAGIGLGCALALFMESMNRGRDEMFARMGAFSGAGHLRVVPAGWAERRDVRLRLADWQRDKTAADELPGVEAVTVRARAQALLAMGTFVVPVEMTGVDPASEPSTFRFVRTVSRGRYLRPGATGEVVVGKAVADLLHADLDDEILATLVGQGGRIEATMLRLAGIVSTGSSDIDASICQVALGDLETLTGSRGAGEVVVILSDWQTADRSRDALQPGVAPGDRVMTWEEVSPDLKGHIEQDKASSRFVSAIILIIVFLGVTSAQLAAVLERRREFAVLAALGVGAGRMVRMVLGEALALGIAGAAIGLALGLPAVWWLSHVGLDFRKLMGGSYMFEGVAIDPIIYGDFGPWIIWYVVIVAVGATSLASLYPAWFAARTDPAAALRVAQ